MPATKIAHGVLPLDAKAIVAFTAVCEGAGVAYGWGAKVNRINAVPGVGFSQVDCSGFFLLCLRRQGVLTAPDGSVAQHDYIRDTVRCKPSTVAAGKLKDGILRAAFLPPSSPGGTDRHVAFIHNAETCESHGGKGVDRRAWTGTGWQARCKVYVLAYAPAGGGAK